jgi:hypothetical protein
MTGESEGGISVDLKLKSSICIMSVRSIPPRLRLERCKVGPWIRSPNANSVVSFLESYEEEQRPLVVGPGTQTPSPT